MPARAILLLLCLAAAWPAYADSPAVVDAFQPPAWVERGGQRMPVVPGMALAEGDRLLSGPGARLRLRLEEGSLVKLGENADFRLRELKPPAQSGGAFSGFLEVLKGAFRFTTTLLSKGHERNMEVRIAAVTVGIRGTDLWGKAASDRDIVCLIEGNVQVQRGGETPVDMTQPLSFYIAPKGKPALPVAPVPEEQLKKWAQETELRPETGAQEANGRFTVYLASARDPAVSRAMAQSFRERGYAAAVSKAEVQGRTWYRVGVGGFTSVPGARAFAAEAERRLGVHGAWVAGP